MKKSVYILCDRFFSAYIVQIKVVIFMLTFNVECTTDYDPRTIFVLGLQHSVILGSEPYGLPLNMKIMPQWLQKLGYRTHMVGKVAVLISLL